METLSSVFIVNVGTLDGDNSTSQLLLAIHAGIRTWPSMNVQSSGNIVISSDQFVAPELLVGNVLSVLISMLALWRFS